MNLEDRARHILYKADSTLFNPQAINRKVFSRTKSYSELYRIQPQIQTDREVFRDNLYELIGKAEEAKSRLMQEESARQEISSLQKEIDRLKANEQILVEELIRQQELCKNSLKIAYMQEQKYSEGHVLHLEEDYKGQTEDYRMQLMEREELISKLRRENESVVLAMTDLAREAKKVEKLEDVLKSLEAECKELNKVNAVFKDAVEERSLNVYYSDKL
eukprot:TRINITY_DN10408_c0_g1_i1.p1 TRINITY_DN10408_c0_g1~~TRINITY_DN10408_c0_g1_i1.p1  ORF type:complete len:218 (+),score=53.40 TRINITY_DN10408_c0_g1_i1:145-798(+)